jgi:GT2 family glycosyltransferase
VVVPAFDAERTIGATVRSVLAQTEPGFEIVVVDDGSTDATAEAVRSIHDPRLRLLRQPNGGVARARNAGIAAARGALVTFLDADDLLMPTYLARMGAALEADPDAGYAFCDAWLFEDGTGRLRRRSVTEPYRPAGPLPHDPEAFFLAHLRSNFVFIATTVRKTVCERVGGFDEVLRAVADYDMWLRIELAGHRAVEIRERLALYRSSDRQMSKDEPSLHRDLLTLLSRLEARTDLPAGTDALLQSRRRQAEQALRATTVPASWDGRRRRLRRAVGRASRRLPGRALMLEHPPPEIEASFPDLAGR